MIANICILSYHQQVDIFGSEWNISTNIGMEFVADIHVPLRMNYNNFGDPLTFHLAPSSGPNFILSNTVVYDQIPAKLVTASAVLCISC